MQKERMDSCLGQLGLLLQNTQTGWFIKTRNLFLRALGGSEGSSGGWEVQDQAASMIELW